MNKLIVGVQSTSPESAARLKEELAERLPGYEIIVISGCTALALAEEPLRPRVRK